MCEDGSSDAFRSFESRTNRSSGASPTGASGMTMSIDQVRRALGRGALRDRFEVFPDPSGSYWIVWDLNEDSVAELGTQLLQHLSEGKARAFCSRPNRPHSKSSLI